MSGEGVDEGSIMQQMRASAPGIITSEAVSLLVNGAPPHGQHNQSYHQISIPRDDLLPTGEARQENPSAQQSKSPVITIEGLPVGIYSNQTIPMSHDDSQLTNLDVALNKPE